MEHPTWTDENVSRLPLPQGRAELLEEIMSTPVSDRPVRPVRPTAAEDRRRWLVPVAAAAAITALGTTPLWWPGDGSSSVDRTGTPAASGAPSGAAQADLGEPDGDVRALLEAPGWKVSSETRWSHSGGEIAYEDADGGEMTLTWLPAARYADRVEDRRHISEPPRDGEPVTFAGAAAQLWAYSATDRTVVREVVDGHFLETRGSGMDRAAFLDLLGRVRTVDPETYRAALAPTGESSSQRELVRDFVDAIARVSGAGLPDGVDEVTPFETEPTEVGLDASRGYACAWLGAYVDATTSGDQDARGEASRVLRTAPRWPVVEARVDTDSMLVASIKGWAAIAADGRPVADLAGYRADLGC